MTLECKDNFSAGIFAFREGFGGPFGEDFSGGFIGNIACFRPGLGLQGSIRLSVYLVCFMDAASGLLGIAQGIGS